MGYSAFYALSVTCDLQTLARRRRVLARPAHFPANNVAPKQVWDTRLIPDMLPLRFQGSYPSRKLVLEAIGSGIRKACISFGASDDLPAQDYRGLREYVSADAQVGLEEAFAAR